MTAAAIPTHTDLREALIDAAEKQDYPTLGALCEQHQHEIRAAFAGWRTVPEPVRADPAAQARYCQGLIAVAELFERAGDRSLMTWLVGDAADNPLLAWERDLDAARLLIEGGRLDDAIELLEAVAARNTGLEGTGPQVLAPRTYGMLGVACFRAGNRARGAELTRRAKDLSDAAGDAEGSAVYAGNLERMSRG